MGKGYDLLPGRIQSEWSELFERTAAAVILIVVVAATILGVVMGFQNGRSEHIFMAGVLVMVTANWMLITRKYLQDVFQERNIVYFGGLVVLFVATATMLYAVNWGQLDNPVEKALLSCTAGQTSACYNPAVKNQIETSGCIRFPSALAGGGGSGGRPGPPGPPGPAPPPPTAPLGSRCMAWNNVSFSFQGLFQSPPKNTTIQCSQASQALQACGISVNCSTAPRPPSTPSRLVAPPPPDARHGVSTRPMAGTTPASAPASDSTVSTSMHAEQASSTTGPTR
eukprot:m.171951 g.171951  ORF g.171951 m.171951 type:complete len:282 (-) comp13450_c0_seq1:1689-2534(-)